MSSSNSQLRSVKVQCERCNLNVLCLPSGLSAHEVEQLDNEVERPLPLDSGKSLFHIDGKADAIYAVRSGSFKTVVSTANGEQQITGFFLPGEIIGMDGLSDGQYACDAVALERSSVCAVPTDKIYQLSCEIPGLGRELLHTAGKAIASDQRRLLLLGQMDAMARIASFLLDISQRLATRGYDENHLHLSMSRNELANYLGLAVETVSRLLSKLRNDEVLAVKNRDVHILNKDALLATIGECADTGACKTG